MTRHYLDLGSASDMVVPLVKFASTNQKHYPDLGSDASSVRNFCARFSDVISPGNRWWRHEMSAVFSGYSWVKPKCFCAQVFYYISFYFILFLIKLNISAWITSLNKITRSWCRSRLSLQACVSRMGAWGGESARFLIPKFYVFMSQRRIWFACNPRWFQDFLSTFMGKIN